MKRLVIFIIVFMSEKVAFSQMADAGPDTVNCKKKGVIIGGKGESTWCYSWQPTTGLSDPHILHPTAKPTTKTTYKLTITGPDFSFSNSNDVDVFILDTVYFKKNNNQKYGFDDGMYTGPTAKKQWKSVVTGVDDPVNVEISQPDAAKFVNIESTNKTIATIALPGTLSSPSAINIHGVNTGTTVVPAFCGTSAEQTSDPVGEINVASYNLIPKTVAVRLVHEQNDDLQNIPVGQGRADQIAITPGTNGILDTPASALGGDDKIEFGNVTTGPDGICQTRATGDDLIRIAFGFGRPNQICIQPGSNKFRDTPSPLGDDVLSGDDILTGPDGICQTPANSSDALSGHYSESLILDFLNNVVYNQAGCKWTLTVLPTITVNADINRDGHISVVSGSDEAQAIIDNSKDDNFDYNIFFVNDVLIPGAGQRAGAVVNIGSKYVFIDVNGNLSSGFSVENTAAHELGHAQGLKHPTKSACNAGDASSNYDDPENIMDYCFKNQLRKFQWDIINK